MSEDLIGFDGGDNNFYRYVGNNPLIYTDPQGLAIDPVSVTITLCAVGVTVIIWAKTAYELNTKMKSSCTSGGGTWEAPSNKYIRLGKCKCPSDKPICSIGE